MLTASLIVDISNIRCGNCKVTVDELTQQCQMCGAIIDRIVSNHVGLARKLTKSRLDAGIEFLAEDLETVSDQPECDQADETTVQTAAPEKLTAQIVVDFANLRCGGCKVAIQDDLADGCTVCGAIFDRVVSNHVGLAAKLERRRNEANGKSDSKNDSKAASPESVTA